ncbi:hypothetical protein AB835_08785 [Candidatus Endobugula sertula]|uniref:DUF4892 domain-containing protein n=1 Tax=Candidatus Endobugula sertula TaxID=62101 RepID=A0A1D2QPD5_9GAMM|nr:hypothetical protein AB835_08785 [Candidatus Endobugula sertula]
MFSMRKLFLIPTSLVLACTSLTVCANGELWFQFKMHPQATILYENVDPKNDKMHILALGKYKKSGNGWLPSRTLRLQGMLKRYTLELPREYDSEELFTFYQQQLPVNAKLLFHCQKRMCGESNNWANDYFRIKQLYGSNASQYYAVFKWIERKFTHYATIYTVRRGNRRLYAQLELLTVENDG